MLWTRTPYSLHSIADIRFLGIIACSEYGVRVHNMRGYQRHGSWTGGGARVEALQVPCMIQPIFSLLRLKAEGQLGQFLRKSPEKGINARKMHFHPLLCRVAASSLGQLGQGSQLLMGSVTWTQVTWRWGHGRH